VNFWRCVVAVVVEPTSLVLAGSFCGGGLVGLLAALFVHPALRDRVSLGQRIKLLGALLSLIMFATGGGAAGLTYLSGAGPAACYLVGAMVGFIVAFLYEEGAFRRGAKRAARRVKRQPLPRQRQVQQLMRNPASTPPDQIGPLLDSLDEGDRP
jgi:hypothetical protein